MKKQLLKTKPYISNDSQKETWELNDSNKIFFKEQVNVYYNKKFDILKLKNNNIDDFNQKAETISESRNKLFKNKKDHIFKCPICNSKEIEKKTINIYNAKYVQCSSCSHNYVRNRLTDKELISFYTNSTNYQSTYTNEAQIQNRIDEIYKPKLDWVLNAFEKKFGRKPKRILDVGTGSGHFVKMCLDQGINCDGIEVSKSGLDFAKKNFNIDLYDKDIFSEWEFFKTKDYDLITFWGLIEHVTDPLQLLKISSKILGNNDSMIVGSVPRLHSLSSFIQKKFPDKIIRHLDPLGHIQMFTDLSLSTLVHDSNFKLDSLWYFGMDSYELLIQLASFSKSDNLLGKEIISELQFLMDINTLSDSMIFTATNN